MNFRPPIFAFFFFVFIGPMPVHPAFADEVPSVVRGQITSVPTSFNGGRSYFAFDVSLEPGNILQFDIDAFSAISSSGHIDFFVTTILNDGDKTVNFILGDLGRVEKGQRIYYNRISKSISLDRLRTNLDNALPEHLKGKVQILPGSPLYLHAFYDTERENGKLDFSIGEDIQHEWGGPARGGAFQVPGVDPVERVVGPRPTSLDLAVEIDKIFAAPFSDDDHGLLVGGQLRSRVEAEGKYQVTESVFHSAVEELMRLSRNPEQVAGVLGDGWDLRVEDRYFLKDDNGNILYDLSDLPVVDPMVDIYYDNDRFDLSLNNMALRYREREGELQGAWNLKPGMGRMTADGIFYRLEYGVDTTTSSPMGIAPFAQSSHPFNPFQAVKDNLPQLDISDIFQPSVKVTAHRYKFLATHTSGVEVELSIDDIRGQSLRSDLSQGQLARLFQIEADIAHLAKTSSNTVSPSFGGNWINAMRYSDQYKVRNATDGQTQIVLSNMSESLRMQGPPDMHRPVDLMPESRLLQTQYEDFRISTEMIVKIRDHLIGSNWIAAPQKAAAVVGVLNQSRANFDLPENVRQLIANPNLYDILNASECQKFLETEFSPDRMRK